MAIETHGLAETFRQPPGRRRHRPGRPRPAVPTVSSAQWLGQDDDHTRPAGPGQPHGRELEPARPADARAVDGDAAPCGSAWSRARPSTPGFPAGTTWPGSTPTGPIGVRPRRRQRIAEALARVGLTAAAKKKYKAYSLGMRQRLGLAWALLRPSPAPCPRRAHQRDGPAGHP